MRENLSEETGLQQLQEDRLKHRKNPLIVAYYNINSLRNKITGLRVIMKTLSLDYLILSETKKKKVLSYRNYKNFIESKFLNDLNKTIISFDNENPN